MVAAPLPNEDAAGALCGGLPERVMRLTLRLVLAALRCAPPSVASDCVASACRLLPVLLDAAAAPARCMRAPAPLPPHPPYFLNGVHPRRPPGAVAWRVLHDSGQCRQWLGLREVEKFAQDKTKFCGFHPCRLPKAPSGSSGFGGAAAPDLNRLHLLAACLVKLAARLRTGRLPGSVGAARQLALARAAADLNAVARVALPGDAAAFPALPPPHDGSFWVRNISYSCASTFTQSETYRSAQSRHAPVP